MNGTIAGAQPKSIGDVAAFLVRLPTTDTY